MIRRGHTMTSEFMYSTINLQMSSIVASGSLSASDQTLDVDIGAGSAWMVGKRARFA